MHGVEANARVGMQDSWIGHPTVEDRAVTSPVHSPVAAAAYYFPPHPEEPMPEPPQGRAVSGYRVILIVAALHASQPFTDLRQRFVHPAPEFLLQLLQFGPHPFARRLAPYHEAPLLRSTVVRESQEVEGLRLSLSTFSP